MITKIVNVNGTRYTIDKNNSGAMGLDVNCGKAAEIYGLSTDEKPTTDVNNADVFYEMDTKKLYLFDETNGVWLEQ